MSNMTPVRAAATIIASVSNAAAASKSGTLDLRGKVGADITAQITNGGTGPTVQCECSVWTSNADGATPTFSTTSGDWDLRCVLMGGGVTASAVSFQSIWIDGPQHVAVLFDKNTAQAVTVKALATVTTSHAIT